MLTQDSTASGSHHIAKAILVALVAGALLAGCSPAEDTTQVGAPETAHGPAQDVGDTPQEEDAARPGTGDTIGGDGSDIRLDALTERDLADADLAGELACGFSTEDAQPILHATGVVASDEPAQGIVKVAGYVERIGAPGGFDGITDDPTFSGQGKTIRIVVTGPAIGGGESPPRPATLTYLRADGASRTFDGRWQCGP